MIALDHVEAHEAPVLDHLHEHRAQRFELIDVIAKRFRETAIGLAVVAALQPHHLRLHTVTHVQAAMLLLELVVNDAQVAATVRGQVRTRIIDFLAVAETRAEDARDAFVPGQLTERIGVRNADQLLGLRPITDVIAVAVGEQVGGGAVNQLKAVLGGALPVIRGDPLAHHPAGDGDELVVDVGDAELVDFAAHLAHLLRAPGLIRVLGDLLRGSTHRRGAARDWPSSWQPSSVQPSFGSPLSGLVSLQMRSVRRHCAARRLFCPLRSLRSARFPGRIGEYYMDQ